MQFTKVLFAILPIIGYAQALNCYCEAHQAFDIGAITDTSKCCKDDFDGYVCNSVADQQAYTQCCAGLGRDTSC